MNIAIFQGEKTIGELVARLFPGSSRAPAKRKQATEALLSANPHLSDLSQVMPGSKVVVPETALPHDPAEATTVIPSEPATRNPIILFNHLELLKTAVPAAADTAVANANATITLMQRAEVQAAAAKDPKLAQQVASITQRANARIQAAQTLQTQLLESLGPLQATLMKSIHI
jgi:phage tail protein X